MDVLTLAGLQYHAHHGYHAEERKEGNSFEVDLTFYADLEAAGASDELTHTIDYQQAEETVRGVMEGPSQKLIETLATKMGDRLFNQFKIAQKLTVCVRKITPPLETKAAHAQIVRTWKR